MMRKIVAGLFVSLDGVYEAPDQWHFPYFNDEMGAAVDSQMKSSDTMLLGRKTYEEFASFWPTFDGDPELSSYMNNTPKLVVSNTLTSLDWQNSTLVTGDVAGQLTAIKAQPGKNIGVTGSGTLVRSLIQDGVLDELHLLIHPIAVGTGKKLWDDLKGSVPLELVSSEKFSTGVIYNIYRPAPAPAEGAEA
jgi:dihydrofolate reductase